MSLTNLPPPPTYAEPVVVNEISGKPQFSPVWLNWFLQVAQNLAALAKLVIPVGGLYFAITSTNPGTTFGYGTWVLVATGKAIVGLDAGDPDFTPAEKTGGSKTNTPSAHAGTAVADHANHTHTFTSSANAATPDLLAVDTTATGVAAQGTSDGVSATLTHTVTQPNTHDPLSVVQPYYVCYVWKRTA